MQNTMRSGWITLLLIFVVLPLSASGQTATSLLHTVKKGENLIRICGIYRSHTNHYALGDLLTDIRSANGLESNFLRIGQELVIPVLEMDDGPQVLNPVTSGAELKGIYLTGPACGVSSVLHRVDSFIEAGGNAVIFDAKDIDGGVSFLSRHPLASYGAGRRSPVISSLPDMIDRFHTRDLYTVARIALFLDGELGKKRPDLALHDPQGNPWKERGCSWIDPAKEEVLEYNLALAAELAEAGVHEIQFDYMRFPTNGWYGDGVGDLADIGERRRKVIEAFLIQARAVLEQYDVKISADLFGIMGWGRVEDLALTGQHVPTIAALVDVICPMIYPSHFGVGFEGIKRPGDAPEYFVGEGTRRFFELSQGQAEIRPWLQAFPYRVSDYDEQYIRIQIDAARDNGGNGWSMWNPNCNYSAVLKAIIPQEPASGFDVLVSLDQDDFSNPTSELSVELPNNPAQAVPAAFITQTNALSASISGAASQNP